MAAGVIEEVWMVIGPFVIFGGMAACLLGLALAAIEGIADWQRAHLSK